MEKLEISFATPLRLVVCPCDDGPPYRAIWTIQFTGTDFAVTGENMANTMSVGTYATVSVTWKDKGGNVVGVEKGSVKWESSDDTIVQVKQAAGNPQIANLYAPSGIGDVQVHATGDADLGEGVKPVTATTNVTVVSGQAVGGEIEFSQSPAQGNPGPNPPSRGGRG
jgi:hypothetical protein